MFTIRQLIFIALMSALLFVVNLTIGSGIIALTGIPGGSAFVTGISNLVVIVFVALTLKKFGSLSLLYLIYGLLALPTDMAGGPPGFIWKIPLLVVPTLLFDYIIWQSNYAKKGFIIGFPFFTVFGFALYLGTFWLLGMPEFSRMYNAFALLAIVFIVLGYFGMWLGFMLYNRLKNSAVLRQISESDD
ncbi:MAG: MptD family putative ECF transporter S component [Candidatus Woesearchaeota archaeon]|nr:MptD family putative ECF transporter S component [Candidatus Woesearchaeota archaeon]